MAVRERLSGDKLIQPLLHHIREVICRNDPSKFEYLVRWLAFAVQHPELPAETVIVLKSTKQGTGKTTLGQVMCDIFGPRHSATVHDKTQIVGRFNDWLGPMAFLLCEEILFAKDHATIDKLKALITGASLQVERKFSSVRQVPNHLHLMLTSNHELPVSLGSADRRYCDQYAYFQEKKSAFEALANIVAKIVGLPVAKKLTAKEELAALGIEVIR